MCGCDYCIYNEPFLINGTIYIPTCENCLNCMNKGCEDFYDVIDDSQWWDKYWETEYAWERKI